MRRILIVWIILLAYVVILCLRGDSDPVRKKDYPVSTPFEYKADSTIYYKNLPITTRHRDTTPYKGRNWVDINN